MLTPNQLQRLSAAAKAAVDCEHDTGLPAEITVAQWALESGWGSCAPGNNCFGIKAMAPCVTQLLPTVEYIHGERTEMTCGFAAFNDLAECFKAHAQLIIGAKPYAQAWAQYQQDHDVLGLIKGIAPHYATDPSYAAKLRGIIAMGPVRTTIEGFRA
jgi:flagellum-specific peptidoglycan hydrolase FlgJ